MCVVTMCIIDNGPEEEGLIVPANYQQVVQCPVNIFKLDLVSPGLLNSSIWSWQENLSSEQIFLCCMCLCVLCDTFIYIYVYGVYRVCVCVCVCVCV